VSLTSNKELLAALLSRKDEELDIVATRSPMHHIYFVCQFPLWYVWTSSSRYLELPGIILI